MAPEQDGIQVNIIPDGLTHKERRRADAVQISLGADGLTHKQRCKADVVRVLNATEGDGYTQKEMNAAVAAQLLEDTGLVEAAAADILNTRTLLGVPGTLIVGRITALNGSVVTMQDAAGNDHIVDLDCRTITIGGEAAAVEDLYLGMYVEVHGNE